MLAVVGMKTLCFSISEGTGDNKGNKVINAGSMSTEP